MRYISEDNENIIGRCEQCRREISVAKTNTINIADGFDLRGTIKCECGNIHNLVLGNTRTQKAAMEKVKFDPNYVPPDECKRNAHSIVCHKCGSAQLYACNRGYALGFGIACGLMFGPYGLLAGFLGSDTVIITCIQCGHRRIL